MSRIIIRSVAGRDRSRVSNFIEINNLKDIQKLCSMVVRDAEATLVREDKTSISIVYHGSIRDEVYNQKELLLKWCNNETDEWPENGIYRKASI